MNKTEHLNKLILNIAKPVYILSNNKEKFYFSHAIGNENMSGIDCNIKGFVPAVSLESLGDIGFKQRHRLNYSYIAGAMANGISSVSMVNAMAKNGMISFFGAGGLSLDQIEKAILEIKANINSMPFGFNLIHNINEPDHEMAVVQLYLKHKISLISAAAFMHMTLPLVYYRIKGIHQEASGKIITPNQIIAKVSRIEVARQFFSPPPETMVAKLLDSGLVTNKEAKLSRDIPMAQDLTAEADSGGHTDNQSALTLLPTMISLKNKFMDKYKYSTPLCVGLGGGIATPESAAAAFSMGAAYILTGSINQSCSEAGVHETVRQLLCQAEQADVTMAPSADMFEIGAKVQVLKRGTMFPIRAEKLYQLYKKHTCFEDIDEKDKIDIQTKLLKTSFNDAWEKTKKFFLFRNNTKEIEKAENSPKHKMALVFRSYLGKSSAWAIKGVPERRIDYQIWCGPAIGAFNQWAKDSFLESHEDRSAPLLALNLLFGASVKIRTNFLRFQGFQTVSDQIRIIPMKLQEILALNRQ